MTPATLARGTLPMSGASPTTSTHVAALQLRAVRGPTRPVGPADCIAKRHCGMRPQPPNPPKTADAALPAPSPSRVRPSSRAMPNPWGAAARTFPARRVSSTEMRATLRAVGRTILRVASQATPLGVLDTRGPRACRGANLGRTASPPWKVPAPATSARVLTEAPVPSKGRRGASAAEATTATRLDGTAVVNKGRNFVTAAVRAATPRVAYREAPARPANTASWLLNSRQPSPLRKPFMTLSSTTRTNFPRPRAPTQSSSAAAKSTQGPM
mmetsp:Transcript_11257/g.26451  ORF Transcript_11257/g.26451 Transcript_11257/m.26451 type:complete len:270 (+) Transcript_11257:370-1179(+)